MMVYSNIFTPRNDWNVISFRCKKADSDPFVNKIRSLIISEYGIDINEKRRYRGTRYVIGRQLFATFLVRHTKKTYEDIGKLMGDKDHSTVTHSIKSINNLCETDNKFKCIYDRIDKKLNN